MDLDSMSPEQAELSVKFARKINTASKKILEELRALLDEDK